MRTRQFADEDMLKRAEKQLDILSKRLKLFFKIIQVSV